jgi:hypothetical protein
VAQLSPGAGLNPASEQLHRRDRVRQGNGGLPLPPHAPQGSAARITVLVPALGLAWLIRRG